MFLWQKLQMKKLFLCTLSILLFSLLLFSLIDISSHSSFHSYKLNEQVLLQAAQFSHRLDVLLPFACLISAIHLALQMSQKKELLALFTSGVSLSKVLFSFALFGLLSTGIIYANNQFLLPYVLPKANLIRDDKKLEHKKAQELHRIRGVLLEDDSILIYKHYARGAKRLEDVYWLQVNHEIIRMKELLLSDLVPEGVEVDLFTLDPANALHYLESRPKMLFPELKFRSKNLLESFLLPEELSYTELYDKLHNFRFEESEKLASLKSSYYKKLLSPWLAFIATLFPIPFCISFERKKTSFSIYLIATCILVCSYLLLQAFFTLSKKQVLSAEWALLPPFLLIFLFAFCGYFPPIGSKRTASIKKNFGIKR